MRSVTLQLPDSVKLSEAEIQQLVLAKISETGSSAVEPATRPGRSTSPEEAAEIRHLIGLYHAERATQLMDELWEQNGWTADTMQQWLREHMRTSHGRPQP